MGKEAWMNSTLVSTVNEPVVKPKALSKALEEGAVNIVALWHACCPQHQSFSLSCPEQL